MKRMDVNIRTIFKPKMSGTQGWILAYFVVLLIRLTICI